VKTNSYVDENLEIKKKIHASFVSKIDRPIVEVPVEKSAEEPTVEPEKNELENEEREPRENRGSNRRKGGNQ